MRKISKIYIYFFVAYLFVANAVAFAAVWRADNTLADTVATTPKRTIWQRIGDEWTNLYRPSDVSPLLIYRTNSIGLGGVIQKDDYLSPLKYGGMRLTLQQEKFLPIEAYDKVHYWSSYACGSFDLSSATNPAGNASFYSVFGDWRNSLLYHFTPIVPRLQVMAGPGLRLGAGGLWSNRNGNNPGSLRLYADIIGHVTLAYRLSSNYWPVLFRLTDQVGLLGLGFSVDYGESYYEYFLVNERHSRGIYFRNPFRSLSNQLIFSIDVPLLDYGTMSVGYRWRMDNSHVHNLTTIDRSHSFMIGYSIYLNAIRGRKNISNKGL